MNTLKQYNLNQHSVENNFIQLCRTFNWDSLDIQTTNMIQILSRQPKLQQESQVKDVASGKDLQSGEEGKATKEDRSKKRLEKLKNREFAL